jgi:glycogen synthase
MTAQKRLKVLVIAEAANPEWVSVPLIGWSLAKALRDVADVHVVTQVRNKDAIERAGWIEGQDFTAIDSEALARPVWKIGSLLRAGEGKGWTALQAVSAASYPYFEHLVWKRFGTRIQAGEFDIVHRVTPLSPTISSRIATKCKNAGVPFVMGPLNGGVPWPAGFDAERRQEREWLSYVRDAYKLLPGRGKTLKAASAILVGSGYTQSEIPDAAQQKTFYIPENGIDPTKFTQVAEDFSGPLKACFVGRLVPYKGLDMLISAAQGLLNNRKMTLDVIGDGPARAALEAQAQDLGIADKITFHGWVEHKDIYRVLSACNLLSFPSIREFGGGVVLEAMAVGVPALVVDYAGPGELVNDRVGFKVPLGTREQIIASLTEKLQELAADPTVLKPLGENAKDYVQSHFTWSQKAAQILDIYRWVLAKGAQQKPKPFNLN